VSARVLILGGYGAVGREVAAALVDDTEVVVAGRHADTVPSVPGAAMRRVDGADPASVVEALDGVDVVVMCAEVANVQIARLTLERGIDYLDVSASYDVLAEIERLDDVARAHDATAVLSVGLAPGITNLLACHISGRSDVQQIEVGVLLGSGEHHGAAAVEWTLDGLGQLDGSWTMEFPAPHGRRTVHRFPFSDQHTLASTLGVTARTGLALDSRLTTALLAAAGRPSIARFLRRPRIRSALLAAMTKVHVGGDDFAVVARSGSVQASFTGRRQSRATGLVTAQLVRRLPDLPAGVAHIEQLVDPVAFLTELAATAGFSVDVGGRAAG
jgi:hypothetical protein